MQSHSRGRCCRTGPWSRSRPPRVRIPACGCTRAAPRRDQTGRRAHLVLGERNEDLALRVHALANLVAQVALDQGLVAAEEKVVGLRPVDPADLVDVAKSSCGEQRTARARALEDGIDGDGGAM